MTSFTGEYDNARMGAYRERLVIHTSFRGNHNPFMLLGIVNYCRVFRSLDGQFSHIFDIYG